MSELQNIEAEAKALLVKAHDEALKLIHAAHDEAEKLISAFIQKKKDEEKAVAAAVAKEATKLEGQ